MANPAENSPDVSDVESFIIPHTHWDREWYVPFQTFRFRLVEMIDHLLDLLERRPEFTYFCLDCQTVVIEDYLEIRPENAERLRALVQAGRIGIGPWYLLSSPWLQTGEGIVRNLLFGRAAATELGVAPVDVGWIPDQFVMPPQLPQVLAGAGVGHCAFSRGIANQFQENSDLACEFWWEGLDGTRVLTFYLGAGYGLNAHLSENIFQALNQMALDQGKLAEQPFATPLQLSFAGSDHCGPQEVLLEAIEAWNAEDDLVAELGRVRLASWPEYLAAFHARQPILETVRGEIAGRRYRITLHGVFSSHAPLKQTNFRAHDLFERWAEPFSVFAGHLGMASQQGFLREGWRWLLKNQPHDSAWTASCDQVEREMRTRFAWATQIGEECFRRGAQWIVQHLQLPVPPRGPEAAIPVVVFNPHPWAHAGLVEARFSNRLPTNALVLEDARGAVVPARFTKVPKGDVDRARRRVHVGSHGPLGANFHAVKFRAPEIPALGYATFLVKAKGGDPEPPGPTAPGAGLFPRNLQLPHAMENERVRVIVTPAGLLTLEDKATGVTYPGLHAFENVGDAGDGWEFIALGDESSVTSAGEEVTARVIVDDVFETCVEISRSLTVPARAAPEYGRRAETTTQLHFQTRVRLERGDSPVVGFTTTVKNTARDHRTRVLFPLSFVPEHVTVNGHFGAFNRPVQPPDDAGWIRPVETTFPHQKFVFCQDPGARHGLALCTRGIPEYEVVSEPGGSATLALTLWRSTGRWGRHIGVSPPVRTPGAQLVGEALQFEYALVPTKPAGADSTALVPGDIARLVEEWYTPCRWEEEFDAFRYHIPEKTRTMPLEHSFLGIEPASVVLSCLKPPAPVNGETHHRLILRVYNAATVSTPARVQLGLPVTRVTPCDLVEASTSPPADWQWDASTRVLSFTIGPHAIVSVRADLQP